MKRPEKAYVYCRVSGEGQLKQSGFSRQIQSCRTLAEKHNIKIVDVYREKGVSGTKLNRPELAKLMVDLEENGKGVKLVLIEKLDRLSRDLVVQEHIISDFKKAGIKLYSAAEGTKLLEDDPSRALVRQVFGSIAQYEKGMLVMKLRAARDRKRKKTGRCEGRIPYGATPAEMEVVKRIRAMRRMKPGQTRRTPYQRIADTLNAEGVPTKLGRPWSVTTVRNILKPNRGVLRGA